MKIEFKEEQKFTQWWLWLLLIGIGILSAFGIYKQLIRGEKFGDNPMPDSALIIFALVAFGVIALFLIMRLTTVIDENEVRMDFFPFVKRRVSWKEIKSAEIVNYGFVGGWGIRPWTKYGTVFNTKGNMGLAIKLVNGKKFLIGTQRYPELRKIVENAVMKNSQNEL